MPICESSCYKVEMLLFSFVGDGITGFLHVLAYACHGAARAKSHGCEAEKGE